MWLIVQQQRPDNYVLATGETHTLREFVELAFAQIGGKIDWRGSGIDERGIDARSGKAIVAVDPRYFGPTEIDRLVGDAGRARRLLG
jgi:GDPmannose 4,6-dehydratase